MGDDATWTKFPTKWGGAPLPHCASCDDEMAWSYEIRPDEHVCPTCYTAVQRLGLAATTDGRQQ